MKQSVENQLYKKHGPRDILRTVAQNLMKFSGIMDRISGYREWLNHGSEPDIMADISLNVKKKTVNFLTLSFNWPKNALLLRDI